MKAALEGGEWSAARPGRTLPTRKNRYPFYRRLGGPQGRSRRAENLVPTGIRSRTVQPVVNRYTDWATRPTHTIYNIQRKSHKKHNYQVWVYYRFRGLDIRTQKVCHSDSVLTAKAHEVYFKLSSVVETIANTYCQQQRRCLRILNYLKKCQKTRESLIETEFQ